MSVRRKITTAERRHQDYLRRKGLQVGSVWEARLASLRRKELKRVLALCRDFNDTSAVIPTLDSNISESGYLGEWWQGLFVGVGVPMAKATAREMRKVKAAADDGIWTSTLRNYATRRAGESISIVTGTWKDSLVELVRKIMAEEVAIGVEALTKKLYRDYVGTLEKWQVRRIAQTEAMIGMAEAADASARTLDTRFVKQWSNSGLQNTRESHLAVDGVTVGQDEPFELAGGLLMYPHDTSMGADASEIINCACACLYRPDGGGRAASPVQETSIPPETTPQTPEEIRAERIKEISAEYNSNIPEEDRKKLAENSLALEKSTGITKGKPMDYAGANKGKENPNFVSRKAYYKNCQTCVPTHEMRRRGFDCEAKDKDAFTATGVDWQKRFLNPDGTSAEYSWSWKYRRDHQFKTMTDKRKYAFVDEATATDGRYEIYVAWKDGKSAHVFCAERSGGKLTYFDPQTNKPAGDYLTEAKGNDIGVMRIDNKIINPKIASLFLAKSGK